MHSLNAFQRQFALAIGDDTAPFPVADQPGLAVYRNTSAKGALDALQSNFPVVLRLVGEEDFAPLALSYTRANPPAEPMLALFGAAFADHVEQSALAEELPYLADVARIERLWAECLFAAEKPPADPAMIAALAEAEMMELSLALHPAVRFAWLETPAATIWLAHQGEDEVEELELEWAPEGALLTRPDGAVTLDIVDAPAIALLAAFAAGQTIGEAAISVLMEYPETDISPTFAQLLARGALCKPAEPR